MTILNLTVKLLKFSTRKIQITHFQVSHSQTYTSRYTHSAKNAATLQKAVTVCT
jgi:hypothetical protein